MKANATSDKFSSFVSVEREHYAGDDNNRVMSSLSQVLRYLRFTDHVLSRYRSVSDDVVARFRRTMARTMTQQGTRAVTAEEWAEMLEEGKMHDILHLEIETYFLFANILLDKIAQCIGDFYGRSQGVSLRSHDRCCRDFERYATMKQLKTPIGIHETMNQLRRLVGDYRDKHITHFQNPRAMRGICITGSGSAQISTSMLYPKQSDDYPFSPIVEDAAKLVSDYIDQLAALIETNRDKSRYQLLRSPS